MLGKLWESKRVPGHLTGFLFIFVMAILPIGVALFPFDCFAPISVIARRVQEVKQELWERKGLVVNHVIITSDEKNATWWDDINAQGWFRVDHSETVEIYGAWYPVLIDAAIQSLGVGFVGTDRSTMSILARRRVQSWQDGAIRTLKWGRPNSDDH